MKIILFSTSSKFSTGLDPLETDQKTEWPEAIHHGLQIPSRRTSGFCFHHLLNMHSVKQRGGSRRLEIRAEANPTSDDTRYSDSFFTIVLRY